MDYMHPTMVDALRGHWPLIGVPPVALPDEAGRIRIDTEYQQSFQQREHAREERALDLQIRFRDGLL